MRKTLPAVAIMAGIILSSCSSEPKFPHRGNIIRLARTMCANVGSPGFVTFESYKDAIVTFHCKNGERHYLLSR